MKLSIPLSILTTIFLCILMPTTLLPSDQAWEYEANSQTATHAFDIIYSQQLRLNIDTFLPSLASLPPCRDRSILIEHIYEAHSNLIFLSEGLPLPCCPLCPLDAETFLSCETLENHLLEMHCQYASCPFKNYSTKESCTYVCEEPTPVPQKKPPAPIKKNSPTPAEATPQTMPQIRRSSRPIKTPPYKQLEQSDADSESEDDSELVKNKKTVLLTCEYPDFKKTHQSQRGLQCHQYSHYPEKKHQCPDCHYKTPYPADLKSHQKSHSEERPYACPHCHYAAKRKSVLADHMCTHSGIKRHFCPHPGCGHRTIQKTNLNAHIRSVHRPIAPTN